MPTHYKCVAKRMNGGNGHEHISMLWWVKLIDGQETQEEGISSRDQMVQFIETHGPQWVWCPDRNPDRPGAWLRVHSKGRLKFVQTYVDEQLTDNLLFLPDR